MRIHWALTHEVNPEAAPGPSFTAFDGDKAVGRVYQIEHGPDRGVWFWILTTVEPAQASPRRTSGRAAERAKAGRALIQAYRRLLADPPTATVAKRRLKALKERRS